MTYIGPRFCSNGFQLTVPGAPFEKFDNVRHTWTLAKKMGCELSLPSFCLRLKKPGMTWDKLIAKPRRPSTADSTAKYRAKAKNEMHDICVELDARKAKLKAR